jgi:hypothetical protein
MNVRIPDELAEMWRELGGELIQACFRWQMFHQLFGPNRQRLELMDATAPHFFEELKTLFVDTAILQICRMTDPPTQNRFDNLVIDQLHLGLDPSRDAEVIGLLKAQADAIKAKSKDLREHRRKRIAHFDKATLLASAKTVLPVIMVKEIDETLKMLGDYLNCFGGYVYKAHTLYTKTLSKFDGEALVYFLQGGYAFVEMERADWTLRQRWIDGGPFAKA